MDSLFKKLTDYAQDGRIPMHMPGHKRRCGIFTVDNAEKTDITEIEGFDDFHNPSGIILQSMEWAAGVYGSRKTFYLVNGSTCGILSAISAATDAGGTLLMARNCHKSVYNAVVLRGLNPVYIYPDIIPEMWINGAIKPSEVEKSLKQNADAQAVIITSPTYEGVVSDVKAIAETVHGFGKLLIVDEAHGAHFNFSDRFPESAVKCGADIVIQSLHKTLPSYTQTALLHICSDRVNMDKVKKYLDIYQTSSPSYVFMAGIEKCIDYMCHDGMERLEEYYEKLMQLRNHLSALKGIGLLGPDSSMYDYDVSKLVISAMGGMTGPAMSGLLRNSFNIEPEMTSDDYVILMTSLCDDFRWYDEILKAASKIGGAGEIRQKPVFSGGPVHAGTETVIKPSDAEGRETEPIDIAHLEGRICAECVYVYPPGIPILMPGERITGEIVTIIKRHKSCGLLLKGIHDRNGEVIQCIK